MLFQVLLTDRFSQTNSRAGRPWLSFLWPQSGLWRAAERVRQMEARVQRSLFEIDKKLEFYKHKKPRNKPKSLLLTEHNCTHKIIVILLLQNDAIVQLKFVLYFDNECR